MQQMTQCGLREVNTANYYTWESSGAITPLCYQPDANRYIDWVKMESHGLIETSSCDTNEEDLSEFQKVL